MPPNNLRSVNALCRNFSTGSRHNSYSSFSSYVTKAARFLTVASGVTLGAGIGFAVYGDCVGSLEQNRQKAMRERFWYDREIEDLREKMWPEIKELKEKVLSKYGKDVV